MIATGVLRHRVDVQRLTQTDNDDGTFGESWLTVDSVWASVQPLTGVEYFEAQQAKSLATHRVRMRHYPGLTVKHRLLFNGRTFNIEAVMDIDERNIVTQAMCKEAV